MLPNKTILDKINKFAIPLIDIGEFQSMLQMSKSYNTIDIWWETLDGSRTSREMFWNSAAYNPSNKATQTREAEDLQALQSVTNGGDWRTIDYSSVWKCRFEDQTYYVK
jgi:hypothetical protein